MSNLIRRHNLSENKSKTASYTDAESRHQSLMERALNQLRSDILQCQFLPNMKLSMDNLRKHCELGTSPIREALMQLVAEGLVVLEQKKGFRVAPVSLDHLNDICRVRTELECLALSWAIKNGDVDWEADVIGAFHRLSRQNKMSADSPTAIDENWNNEHRRFHYSLVSGCGSPHLLSALKLLYDQSERYVALSIANRELPRDDVEEHEALMNAAIFDRDTKKACSLCRNHLELTAKKVAATLSETNAI